MMSHSEKSKLLSELTVNKDAYDALCSEIVNNAGSLIPQPVLVIGQNGAGKTTLLHRVYNSEFCRKISAVWIDGRVVFSSHDIISRAMAKDVSVVFIDDMDYFLTRCDYQEQFRLRRFLNEEHAPMLIASVSKMWGALSDYDAPFFEGLKNIYLSPISLSDISSCVDQHDFARMKSLLRLLPPTVKSVEIAYSIIRINYLRERDNDVLLSIFEDKYRNCYFSLPTNSQHILNAFGTGAMALNIAGLRDLTGLPNSIMSAYLKSLESLGIIYADRSMKRKTMYSMRDPLYQLWLSHNPYGA